jgi:hypothetical protein
VGEKRFEGVINNYWAQNTDVDLVDATIIRQKLQGTLAQWTQIVEMKS